MASEGLEGRVPHGERQLGKEKAIGERERWVREEGEEQGVDQRPRGLVPDEEQLVPQPVVLAPDEEQLVPQPLVLAPDEEQLVPQPLALAPDEEQLVPQLLVLGPDGELAPQEEQERDGKQWEQVRGAWGRRGGQPAQSWAGT